MDLFKWSKKEIMITKWKIDPSHSEVQFKVKHLMITTISGHFHSYDLEVLTEDDDFTTASKIEFAADVDLVACIIYRGKTFGNLFGSLKATFDKPVLLSEFGADAYDAYLKKEEQNMQAFFLESQWRQIYENLANNKEGAGNCLGGISFEWTDEWWKHDESNPESWKVHDTESNWSNGSYYFDIRAARNMNMNEEWFGIVALSEVQESGLNKRIPRKSYYVLRDFWEHPTLNNKKRKMKSKWQIKFQKF